MLYHWYELNLETSADLTGDAEPATACPRYDKAAAIFAANGGAAHRNRDIPPLSADNDRAPDTVGGRLRDAGLGMIGHPAHRASPEDYKFLSRTRRRFGSIVAALFDRTYDFLDFAWHACRSRNSRSSHMTVSYDGDVGARDGARQQRLGTS